MDRYLEAFLRRQRVEGLALAEQSDRLDLVPLGGDAPTHYLVGFDCNGFVRAPDGEVRIAQRHEVGIAFPRDYLRRADFLQVLTWIGPAEILHPNIHGPARRICPGPMAPGTRLVDLIYQIYEVITCFRVNMRETDCLNPAACPWARANQHLFPVDRRPLKRAPFDVSGVRGGDAA